MNKSIPGFFLVLIAVLFSCEKSSEIEDSKCSNFEVSYDKTYALSDSWKVVAFVSANSEGEECLPQAYSDLMDIQFPTDTSFIANSTCNLFEGSYYFINADEIKVNNVKTTEIVCFDEDFEYWDTKFFKELLRVKYLRIDGNKLVIHTFTSTEIICKAVEK